MTYQNKIAAIVVAVSVAIIAALIFIGQTGGEDPAVASPDASTPAKLVRDNSHRLSVAIDNKVTLVEFLDFECEACRAAYPFIEDLREKYAGKVTFVVRYFPIPSHQNAFNAAMAVEAAAQQDKFEPMYKRMYQTQAQWGEKQESKASLFRSFAKNLGLDLNKYDIDVASTATKDRITLDQQDGAALGVSGTPTFFLNGKKVTATTTEEFTSAIDKALNG